MWLPADVYDAEQSEQWARRIAASPKICWINALEVLSEQHDLGFYVEGFALASDDIPRAHAWIETVIGRVIDPTYPVTRLSADEPPFRYLPVLRFRWAQVYRFSYERFPRYNDGDKSFKLEKVGAWGEAASFVHRHRHKYAATGEVVSTIIPGMEGKIW